MDFQDLPQASLVDEQVALRLTGGQPGSTVTIRARMHGHQQTDWASHVDVEVGQDGVVDLARQAPTDGTYQGVRAMGLFTSMRPSGEPVLTGMGEPVPQSVTITAETADGHMLAKADIERRWTAPGVTRHEVRDGALVGSLYLPPGDGSHPGVLVITGSGGKINETTAALLANHGLAALGLAYFGMDGVAPNLVEIPLELFRDGIRWLRAHPAVQDLPVGLTGASRGGEGSLLIASAFPEEVGAVAAIVPSGLGWAGFGATVTGEPPAWTLGGEPVPFLPAAWVDEEPPLVDGAIASTPLFRTAMQDPEALARAEIPVERISAPLLLVSGTADAMWPSTELAEIVEQRLRRHGHTKPVTHLICQGAGHLITPPYQPVITAIRHTQVPEVYALGGTHDANADACEASWQQVLTLFRTHLG